MLCRLCIEIVFFLQFMQNNMPSQIILLFAGGAVLFPVVLLFAVDSDCDVTGCYK